MYNGVQHQNISEKTFLPDTIDNNPFIAIVLQAREEMLARWAKERLERARK